MAQAFSAAVQLCLDEAQNLHTSSRAKIHKASYYRVRESFGLPSDYARMAVNACVSLARSYYGRRKVQKHTASAKANGAQGIGLGVASYAITENNGRWFLRCPAGKRGSCIWLPLCVPAKWRERMDFIYGDAQLFERNGDW